MPSKEIVRKHWRYIVVSLALLVGIALLSQSVFASVGVSTIQAAVPASHTLAGDPKVAVSDNEFLAPLAPTSHVSIAAHGSDARCPGFTSGLGVCDHTQQSVEGAIIDTDTPTSTNTPTSTPNPCGPVWSAVSSPNPGLWSALRDVAVVTANDVWAVGTYYNGCGGCAPRTLVEHWDGTSWSVVPSPNVYSDSILYGVAAVSTNDVWAVGYRGNGTLTEHWDGTSWSVVPSPYPGTSQNYLYRVAAVSATDVWAVGYYCNTCGPYHTLVEHWDGTSWSVVPSPDQSTSINFLQGVAAVSATDVWAVGFYCTLGGSGCNSGPFKTLVEHWDGTSWSVVSSPNVGTNDNRLLGVAAVSANDVWAVGWSYSDNGPYRTLVEHWDGTSWSVVPGPNVGSSDSQLYGITAVSANDVWAVGAVGYGYYSTLIGHWDGTSWSVVSSSGPCCSYTLYGIAAASANDVWAVGGTAPHSGQPLVQHYASLCGTPTNTPAPGTPTSTPTRTNTPAPTATVLPGDANSDNVVDGIDFSIVKANFGRGCNGDPLCSRADFDYNGIVNAMDFHEILVGFGLLGGSNSAVPPSSGNAFLSLQPGIAGNCSAPPNGGTVQVGCRFVLDLMVNMGSVADGVVMQSYMTFTSSLVQNARVSSIASSCVPTYSVTSALTTFDATLQQEVCDGPGQCVFRGQVLAPGSLAFAQGALSNCPTGCGGTFRVAQVGLCAVAPGQAVLHWQFSPPAPRNRHTAIVDVNGNMVQNQSLFTDYVINIVPPTSTATSTPTITPTPTPYPILVGHVTIEGRPGQPNALQSVPITFTLKVSAGGPENNYSTNTDASGFFTITSPAGAGLYNWRVKNPQTLANSGSVTLPSSGTTQQEMGLLREGDANNDNCTSALDFNIVRNSFGKGVGDPGYDSRADFNGDSIVNITDFNLLKGTFGQCGAGPIRPAP